MRLLRKYWVWVLICTIACAAGAWIVGAISPARYTSTASVDVEASPIPGSQPATVNTSTEKEVASSGVVLSKASPHTGLSTDQLSSHVSIAVPSGANVLSISCTMPDPAAAQRCATAVTQAYMNFRNDVYTPKAAPRDPLTVTLVSAAQLPTKPSGLRLTDLLPLGALIGVLLGFGTAYLRDRADDRVRDRDDLEECLGEPVLAVVPRSRSAAEGAKVFATEPGSAAAEAFRYLRAHVEPLIPADGNGGKVLLVTGAQRQEGRSSVACNLATALAQAGRRVLLVDADLRHPFLADVFETGSRAGLTELLAGEATLADVAAPTGRQNLQLVTAGRKAGEPSDVLNSDSLARAIGAMRAAADVIVVDSGPAVSVSDPVTIAQLSDLVLQVANVRRTPRAAIRAAAQELRTSSPIIEGTGRLAGVLTGVPGKPTIHRPQVRPAQQPQPEPARATATKRDLVTGDARASVAPVTRH